MIEIPIVCQLTFDCHQNTYIYSTSKKCEKIGNIRIILGMFSKGAFRVTSHLSVGLTTMRATVNEDSSNL